MSELSSSWPWSEVARCGQLLLALAGAHTARLINISDLAAPFHISRQTIHDYVTVLERIFLLERLAPWHSNHLSRLVKTPKLHMGDTGLACALLGVDAAALHKERERLGPLLETSCCKSSDGRPAGDRTQSSSFTIAIAMTLKWISCWSSGASR
jgi:hypothetical protein